MMVLPPSPGVQVYGPAAGAATGAAGRVQRRRAGRPRRSPESSTANIDIASRAGHPLRPRSASGDGDAQAGSRAAEYRGVQYSKDIETAVEAVERIAAGCLLTQTDLCRTARPLAIGSLPHTDPAAAVDVMFSYNPDCPGWPQLPKIDFRESMYIQYAEGMPAAVVDEAERRDLVRHREGAGGDGGLLRALPGG